MHQFEVWAPDARRVAVEVDGKALPMLGPDVRGWWRLDVEQAGPGTEYGYLLDDDAKAYPDPRSHWQPYGVHNRSRIYDQTAFAWGDAGFQPKPLASGILYELHIGTFTEQGTLDAAIGKLDYLANLGVTHIELMPVAAFAGDRGWGYDGVALFAVHEALRRTRCTEAVCRCRSSTRARGAARRGVQPFRSGRKLHGQVRPLSGRFPPYCMGRGGQSRRGRVRPGKAILL